MTENKMPMTPEQDMRTRLAAMKKASRKKQGAFSLIAEKEAEPNQYAKLGSKLRKGKRRGQGVQIGRQKTARWKR